MTVREMPRYRVRREWNGLDLFDRDEGRVTHFSLDSPLAESLLKWSMKGAGGLRYSAAHDIGDIDDTSDIDDPVDLVKLGRWNLESLIDTPYTKVPEYASAPRRIYWELTRRCNLNCRSCFNRRGSISDEMAQNTILKLAEQLYSAGVYEIRCTGGEPTKRDDLFEILEGLYQMGFYISLASNGIYPEKTRQKLMKSSVDWIILSIDGGCEDANAEIRGPGNFARAVSTLKALKEKGCRIRINTLIRRGHFRYQHLKGLAEICEEQGVESLNCIPLRPMTNDPAARSLQLSPAEFREFVTGLKQLKQEYKVKFVTTLDLELTSEQDRIYLKDRSCAAGREGAVISPQGDIYGCSYSPASDPDAAVEIRKRYVAGNLLEEDFLTVWNDSSRWAIYRDLKKYKNKKCKICNYYLERRCIGNCPIMKDDPGAFDPYCYLHLIQG